MITPTVEILREVLEDTDELIEYVLSESGDPNLPKWLTDIKTKVAIAYGRLSNPIKLQESFQDKDYDRAKQLIPDLDIETTACTYEYWWGNCKLLDTEEMRQLAPTIAKIFEQEYDYIVNYTPGSLCIGLKSRID